MLKDWPFGVAPDLPVPRQSDVVDDGGEGNTDIFLKKQKKRQKCRLKVAVKPVSVVLHHDTHTQDPSRLSIHVRETGKGWFTM